MVLYTRARVGPTMKTLDGISIICLFRLILQAKSFVLFYFGIRVASKSSVDSIPFKWCSHISMGVLILLDHWGCHVNSFPTGALLFEMIPSFSPSARSILSFLNSVCFVHPKLSLFFTTLPPLFFKDSYIIIKYPFIHVKSLHSFQSMFWSGDPSWRCSRASSSSFFILVFFSGGLISSFGVDHIPFLVSNVFPRRCTS